MLGKEEQRLPENILKIAVRSDNEFGWKQKDVLEVIEAAKKVPMAIIGGQVQYVLPAGTCELYWLSYDATDRKTNERWIDYCNRTANEVSEKFRRLLSIDIQKEAVEAFSDILSNDLNAFDKLNDYQTFILYFDDTETDSF